jgi:hypothetical protein
MFELLLTRVVLPLSAAAAIVALAWVLLRRDAPMWVFLVVLLAAPLALLQLSSSVRVIGWHNLLHSSFVYQIGRGVGAPENPMMAGERLYYYYGEHWLLAQLMRVVPLAPTVLFAIFDVAAAIITAVALDRVAVRLESAKPFRVFAVMMGLLGTSMTAAGLPLKLALKLGIDVENRVPPLDKFFTANNNPIGLAASSLVLLGLVKLVDGSGDRKTGAYALVGFGLVAAGLLYPMSLVPSAAATGLVGLVLLARSGDLRRGAILLAVLAASVAPIYPYLRAITAGKSGSSGFTPVSQALLVRELENLALVAILPVLVWALSGRRLREFLDRNRPVAAVLVLWSAVGAALFLLVAAPMNVQYKFLATSLLGLGVLVGAGLALLYRSPRLRPLAFLVPLSVLFGTIRNETDMVYDWRPSVRIVEAGTRLRDLNPDQDRLYSWIDKQTPADAVFLDDTLMVPVLGRRTMYVGYVIADQGYHTHHDGWGIEPSLFLHDVTGVNPSEYEFRFALARNVFSEPDAPIDAVGLRRAAEKLGDRPLYVIARDPRTAARLEGLPFVEQAFRNPAASVIRVDSVGNLRASSTTERAG